MKNPTGMNRAHRILKHYTLTLNSVASLKVGDLLKNDGDKS